tara:strand:+ start:292 stop:735 length:444 start_codon:yes stop_codon:yes gene_type:complete
MENLRIDEEINKDLRKAAGWLKFLSILLYIWMGFTILGALVGVVGGAIAMSYSGSAGAVTIISYLIYGVVGSLLYYFPASYGMGFSNKIKEALDGDNQENIQSAFRSLASYFKFYGVLNIVMLCLCVFGIILFIAMGTYFMTAVPSY